MYANRQTRTPLSPTGMAAAIAVNVAVVSAIALSAPEFRKSIETTITATHIPLTEPPPPPPKPPEVRKTVEQPRPADIFRPETIIKLPTDTINDIRTVDLPPLPPPPPGDPIGTGPATGVTVEPPLPLPPVMTGAEVDPRYAAGLQPDYPADMRRAELEGAVVVRVLIGTDGRVKAVEQVRAPHEAFFTATRRQALSRWRFRPATRDGVPFETWKTMTVRFSLLDAR